VQLHVTALPHASVTDGHELPQLAFAVMQVPAEQHFPLAQPLHVVENVLAGSTVTSPALHDAVSVAPLQLEPQLGFVQQWAPTTGLPLASFGMAPPAQLQLIVLQPSKKLGL
jgi:hypothetical protein